MIHAKFTLIALVATFLFSATAQETKYTLTDQDVEVVNGAIVSCDYAFENTNIVIPEQLDQQTVTKIDCDCFSSKNITSVELPKSITYIGNQAFSGNSITELNLNGYTALEQIGDKSFSGNPLSIIDLGECSALKTIGWQTFYNNQLTELNLDGCVALSTIGENAFADHQLKKLDLNSCISLVEIKGEAFNGNQLKSYKLPTPKIENRQFKYWVDSNKKQKKGGATVKTLWNSYTAVFEDTEE